MEDKLQSSLEVFLTSIGIFRRQGGCLKSIKQMVTGPLEFEVDFPPHQ